jgi:uroporphyrinogen III methyltransferase/synthase
MTVHLVGAGPGDPGLLTRLGAEVLSKADVVLYDRLVGRAILALAGEGAELVDVGKQPGPSTESSEERQARINALIIEAARAGRRVVRLKGGDPFVFGRGGEEAQACQEAGVPFAVVPGVSAAFAVPAYAGIPVTHRGVAGAVTVVTGHVGEEGGPADIDWTALAELGGTLVILMGMEARAEIARRLIEGGRDPATPVGVVQWGTTGDQRQVRTRLAALAEVSLGSPAVIVVGEVAALGLDWWEPPPLAGRRVVVTRPRHQSARLVRALARRGAEVVPFPVFDISDPLDGGQALAAAAGALSQYAWVVFTSANAVERFLAHVRDGRDLAAVQLAAVGDATAGALARHHLVADLVAGEQRAEGLARVFPEALLGQAVLFPVAQDAGDVLVQGLEARGYRVDPVIAYQALPVGPPDDRVVAELAAADAVCFASPSAVWGYVTLTDRSGAPLPMPPTVACIGPVTSEAARAAGLHVSVEATEPSAKGLASAIEAALGAPEPPGRAAKATP